MIPLAVSAKSEYPQPDRLVVVGDIHGDGRALNHILQGMVVMDADGNWRGGKTVVVVMGDVLDRGLDSRTAMDTLMRLEKQARKAGGRVITLLGNHELMISYGNLTYFAQRDVENYLDFKRRADE